MVRNLFMVITRLSIRFRYVTVVLAVLCLLLGTVAFTRFNQELIPSIEFPQTFILIQAQGTTADELVSLMTVPIEERVMLTENVVNVQTTTGAGFAFLQISNEFGINQEALRGEIRQAISAVWAESGLARPWESVDVGALRTTADVTPAAVGEVGERWPYLLGDLEGAQLLSLPADAAGALPDEILDALPGDTRRAVLDIAAGEREPGEPVALPQSWLGLSRTADLTPEALQRVLQAAPTMADRFRNDDGDLIESYVFAMSPDVIRTLPPELLSGMNECSVQQLDAVIAAQAHPDPPGLLPGAWRASPPELITFSFSDLPLAYASVSGDFSQEELRALVEDEVVPRLIGLEGVANAPVSGGQVLPGEEDGEAAPAEEQPDEAPHREGTPIATPLWLLIAGQLGQAVGQDVQYYEDLTPEITNLVLGLADGLDVPLVTAEGLLNELRLEESIRALPAETLAWTPERFADDLSDELRALADARVAEETRYDETGAAARLAAERGALPVYFRLFASLGQQFGLPLTMSGPEDLTPEIVGALNSFVPGGTGVELLRPLSQAAWERVPVETLGWLSPDFVAGLDEDVRVHLEERAEAVGGVGMLARRAEEDGALPPFFALLARQPLLGGVRLCGPEELTPELVAGMASFVPDVFDDLSPAALRRLSPEALAALPLSFADTLPEGLRAELEDRAESAGGLGAAAEAADTGAPMMPDSWDDPRLPRTAADLVNGQFGAAGFFNMMVQFDAEMAASLFADLTPEIMDYLIENEEGFLDMLGPGVLSLFSPEVIERLPETYREIAANAFIPTDAVTRTNGQRSLLLTVFKDAEANTVEVSHRLFEELDRIEEELEGVTIEVAFEQSSFIEESISGVTREGGLGAIFAIIIIYLFLNRSWRSTVVTAVSIPLSLMIALAAMLWLSPALHRVLQPLAENEGGIWRFVVQFFPAAITLNIMTLSGLTVAIGRVVDDSIVVLENIYRHIQSGVPPSKAVLVGAREVSIAIFASTVTTVVVFLPIGLTGGLIGAFFLPFGMAATYSLGASFIVAITVVPVLARWFVRREQMPERRETTLQRWYTSALKWALGHRAAVLAIAVVLFVASVFLMAQRPRTFIPAIGEPQIAVTVSLPQGTSIIPNNELVLQMEAYLEELKAQGKVDVYQTVVGATVGMEALIGGGGVEQTAAEIDIMVVSPDDLDDLSRQIRQRALVVFGPDNVKVSAATISETGFGGLGLVLSGDTEVLREIDAEVLAALGEIEGVANLSSSLELASQVGEAAILRVGGQPAVKYTAEFETDDTLGATALAKQAVVDMLAEKGLSETVAVSEGFETEIQTEGFSQIFGSLGLAIGVVYFVMVLTFRSFVHPFTILFSLPLAVVGAALGLWLADRVLGLPAMVGLLMLVGIVVTNAIVLIDRVQANRKERGMSAHAALIEGGQARLRPILMTALAAIMALIPLAAQLTGPGGAIIAAELGTVVIGGLATSTLLTLLVVPVVYSLLDGVVSRLNGRQER